ncbi:MAG: hypothetical protein NDJ89_05055 [Oligoflexia bacterium]|nr:hypothetical protein [Oligoflexia bacterium]
MALTTLQETDKTRLDFEVTGDEGVFRPSGVLDEDVNLGVLLPAIQGTNPPLKKLTIDLGHVTRMNSCGIREWILTIDKITSAVPCVFENLNELFVEQATMIPVMFGKQKPRIGSFQLPYHCGNCNLNIQKTLTLADLASEQGPSRIPSYPCPKCAKPLGFDWLEDEYLAFIDSIS